MSDEVDRFRFNAISDASTKTGRFLPRRTSKLSREQVRYSSLPDMYTRHAVTIITFTSTEARNTSVTTIIVTRTRYAVTFIEEFHCRRELT